MPRPSTTDHIDTSQDLHQRLNTTASSNLSTSTTNVPLTITSHTASDDLSTGNSTIFASSDYHQQQSTPTRFIKQYSLPTTLSDKNSSNINLLSTQKTNDSTISSYDRNTSSPNSIPTQRSSSIKLNNNPNLIRTITTPLISPVQSLSCTTTIRPVMEDKSIQCIDDNENSTDHNEQLSKSNYNFLDDCKHEPCFFFFIFR